MNATPPLLFLSLGAGVQSSALFVMSSLGLRGCPRAEFAIFADTQDEASWTYEHLAILKAWPKGMPIVTVTRGRLTDDPVIRVPAFVKGPNGPAPLTQNCTRDYKITPIRRAVRAYMRERAIGSATMQKGISCEEAHRMMDSGRKWLTHAYPLIDAGMKVAQCERVLLDNGLPVPRKSACVQCPWRSPQNWLMLRDHDPAGWQKALAYDDRVRAQRGASLHRSLIRLRDVSFKVQQKFNLDGFGNECQGVCGV